MCSTVPAVLWGLKLCRLTDNFTPTVCLSKQWMCPYGCCLHVSGLVFKHNMCCLCWQCTVKAASVLHDKLFSRILHCPMHFFDTTPLGRILTRFSRDMDEGESWFVLTVNLSPRRPFSQWSHPGWQGIVQRHSVIWHGAFSLVSGSLLCTSLVSLLDMLICELLFLWVVGFNIFADSAVFLPLIDFPLTKDT